MVEEDHPSGRWLSVTISLPIQLRSNVHEQTTWGRIYGAAREFVITALDEDLPIDDDSVYVSVRYDYNRFEYSHALHPVERSLSRWRYNATRELWVDDARTVVRGPAAASRRKATRAEAKTYEQWLTVVLDLGVRADARVHEEATKVRIRRCAGNFVMDAHDKGMPIDLDHVWIHVRYDYNRFEFAQKIYPVVITPDRTRAADEVMRDFIERRGVWAELEDQ